MILLAFPGTGKTPLARKDPRYLDLDFGFFRTALGVKKEDEAILYQPFVDMARMYEDQGFVVLTNEPGILDHIARMHDGKSAKPMWPIKMILPKETKYSAKKLGVSKETVQNWIADWEVAAKRNNVKVTYISTGLDHYLGDRAGKFTSTHKKGGKSS